MKLNLYQRCGLGLIQGEAIVQIDFLKGTKTNRIGEKVYSVNTWPLSASSLSRYSWRTAEWTECRVDPLLSQQDRRRGNQTALCGGGIQTREVYCVQAGEDLLSQLSAHKDKEGKSCLLLKYSPMESRHGIILQGYICSHLGA